jgi:hypothetical protein
LGGIGVRDRFVANTDANDDDSGSKWSLTGLFRYLRKHHTDAEVQSVWEGIKDIVIKTVISAESCVNTQVKMHVPHRANCYELYGFDILLDKRLKPWLLEVNTGPDLATASPLDKKIKYNLVTDLFNLVGFMPVNRKSCERQMEERKKSRLLHRPSVANGGSSAAQNYARVHEFLKSDSVKDWWRYLTPEAITVLQESEEELARCRTFERIFPTASESTQYYLSLFPTKRYYNICLAEWVRCGPKMPKAAKEMVGLKPGYDWAGYRTPMTVAERLDLCALLPTANFDE